MSTETSIDKAIIEDMNNSIFNAFKTIINDPKKKDRYGQTPISYFSESDLRKMLSEDTFDHLKRGLCPYGKFSCYGNRYFIYYAVTLDSFFYETLRARN